MRVITGLAKGIRLETLDGISVRPTTDKIKGSMFNSIQFNIEERNVLDLFAGSGQLGIEALSRGAKKATFIDSSEKALKIVSLNLNKSHLSDKATCRNCDYKSFLASNSEKFDLVFIDPPYGENVFSDAITRVINHTNPNSIIICEHPNSVSLPESFGDFTLSKSYKFGKIGFSIYRN